MSDELKSGDLSDELWREYSLESDFGTRVYRIDNPKTLYWRVGGSTHRVVDAAGVVHLLPGPGYRNCVIRWMPRDTSKPVTF
jgi:hypothetical protein